MKTVQNVFYRLWNMYDVLIRNMGKFLVILHRIRWPHNNIGRKKKNRKKQCLFLPLIVFCIQKPRAFWQNCWDRNKSFDFLIYFYFYHKNNRIIFVKIEQAVVHRKVSLQNSPKLWLLCSYKSYLTTGIAVYYQYSLFRAWLISID